jgi:hypothetical protein
MLQFFKQLFIFLLILVVPLIVLISSILALVWPVSFAFASIFIPPLLSLAFSPLIVRTTLLLQHQCLFFLPQPLFFFQLFIILIRLDVAIFDENFFRLLQVDSMSAALMDGLALVHDKVLPELYCLFFIFDAEHNSVLVKLLSNSVSLRSGLLGIVIHQTHHDVLFKSWRTECYQRFTYIFYIIISLEELKFEFEAFNTRLFSL